MVNILPVLDDEDVSRVAKRRRRCRLNRMIITSESSLYAVVMWDSGDTVAFITDILAHKSTAQQDHICLFLGTMKLDRLRAVTSYNIRHDDTLKMVIKAPPLT